MRDVLYARRAVVRFALFVQPVCERAERVVAQRVLPVDGQEQPFAERHGAGFDAKRRAAAFLHPRAQGGRLQRAGNGGRRDVTGRRRRYAA